MGNNDVNNAKYNNVLALANDDDNASKLTILVTIIIVYIYTAKAKRLIATTHTIRICTTL